MVGEWLNAQALRKQDEKERCGYFFVKPRISRFSLNVTHSKTRYALFPELYDEEQISLGGVTTEWLAAAHQAMNKLKVAHAYYNALACIKADDDAIIDNNRQRVAQLMPNAKLEIAPRLP